MRRFFRVTHTPTPSSDISLRKQAQSIRQWRTVQEKSIRHWRIDGARRRRLRKVLARHRSGNQNRQVWHCHQDARSDEDQDKQEDATGGLSSTWTSVASALMVPRVNLIGIRVPVVEVWSDAGVMTLGYTGTAGVLAAGTP